jgi:hypothetical protein
LSSASRILFANNAAPSVSFDFLEGVSINEMWMLLKETNVGIGPVWIMFERPAVAGVLILGTIPVHGRLMVVGIVIARGGNRVHSIKAKRGKKKVSGMI